jgi:hypothetical protein
MVLSAVIVIWRQFTPIAISCVPADEPKLKRSTGGVFEKTREQGSGIATPRRKGPAGLWK